MQFKGRLLIILTELSLLLSFLSPASSCCTLDSILFVPLDCGNAELSRSAKFVPASNGTA